MLRIENHLLVEYKLKNLCNFTYYDDRVDKGEKIRNNILLIYFLFLLILRENSKFIVNHL